MTRLPLEFRLSRAIDRAQTRLDRMAANRVATGAEMSAEETSLRAELADIKAKLVRLVTAKTGA